MTKLLSTAAQHTRAGRLSRAVSCYRKVLAVARPGEHFFELAHYKLGSLHIDLGQGRSAVAHLKRARVLDDDETAYALELGRALRLDALGAQASTHLMDATRSFHHRVDALKELAAVSSECGDRATARELILLALRLSPEDDELREVLVDHSDA